MKNKNKTFKKVGAIALCIGLLASIGIGAYLTDSDVKSDVYTVGNVQAEIVANGDMELDNVGALLPGTVHIYERAASNTGINDAYVFMSITIPYEMIGVADSDGTQLGEKTMQIFIPGSADGYVSSEWKLVDSGFIGQYEIEENEQLNGEHEQHSTVVGNTITYVYGYIGDNADGSLKALASGETTANLVETMKLTNLYRADNITGEVSTKLYAIQSNHVNGGLTDVNGVWAVINHALVGTENEVQSTNTLMVGELFNAYIPNDVTSVEFVAMPQTYGLRSATAPEGAFDVSAAQDGSVMAWSEDGVFYVAAMNGEKIIANKNSDKMFYKKTNLTYINTENLDMSQVESAAYMFNNCATLTNDISDFNLTNVKNIEATFSNCQWLTEYTIPNSVEVIGEGAFANCSNLSNIEIPESVKAIEGWAFQATGLTSIVIPKNVKTIAYGTFMISDNLTHVTLSEGLAEIGEAAFGRCENLQSITIPASVEKIDNMAFYGCYSLTSVVFEDGSNLETIGYGAFCICNLNSIYIPASVEQIGDGTFDAGTIVNIDPANEYYVVIDDVLFTKNMKTLVQYLSKKDNVKYEVPEGVERIGADAFSDYSNLTTIVIPSTVKEIGDGAFSGTGLVSIELPEGIETIGIGLFRSCSNLTSITIPNSVTSIGEQAFFGCVSLETINVPASVTSIGERAFNETKWLQDKLDAGETTVVVNGITVYTINYTFPEGTTSIENQRFAMDEEIISVIIPASVDHIGEYAFYGCPNLKSVTFEEGSKLKEIGYAVFAYCPNLTDIVLPDNLEVISDYALYGCSGLTEVTIPGSVTTIGEGAFSDCSNLKTINFAGTEEQWNAITFGEEWSYGLPADYIINFLGE